MARRTFTHAAIHRAARDLGVLGEFPIKALRKGANVELEHGRRDPQTDVTHDDVTTTLKIALAHLRERPDYYDLLEQVERAARPPRVSRPKVYRKPHPRPVPVDNAGVLAKLAALPAALPAATVDVLAEAGRYGFTLRLYSRGGAYRTLSNTRGYYVDVYEVTATPDGKPLPWKGAWRRFAERLTAAGVRCRRRGGPTCARRFTVLDAPAALRWSGQARYWGPPLAAAAPASP